MEEHELTDEYGDVTVTGQEKKSKGNSFLRSQLIIVTQVIICALALGYAFAAKAIGGKLYAAAASWYFDSYNASLFTGGEMPASPFTEEAKISETSLISPEQPSSSSTTVKPLRSFVVTSPYGSRENDGKTEFHKGADLAAEDGSKIYAVYDGEVMTAETDASYGSYIVLRHSDGTETLYAHCSQLLVRKGDKVSAGQEIAVIGSTGDADGTHLHFELHRDGKPVDPAAVIGDG